ncbi:cysteine proteinase [Patellaria atrata CBS 101060]|uniref:ubiquitinyl hydrolase 1 n=1 Tax=Patellaria atrata CBS 101060 TaxID=1346257 RepID=A0A9P4SBY9_9PEZI|nr:cysteine proteinase [Patellaria atrata CBS 101060]
MSRQVVLPSNSYSYLPSSLHEHSLASLSYRTPQQQQLTLRSPELPASINFATSQTHHPSPNNSGMGYVQSEEELAELEKLSNEYRPVATGPLVGERQPSNNITAEYANADPVYRAKTAALPQKYSHYRTCRGDGHCGWRAIAFGYFENLARVGDALKFQEEETRLRSMGNILNAVGFDEELYEDFAGDTYDLLRKIAATIGTSDDGTVLFSSFNDEPLSLSIITYLKLLTSAWMQTRPDEYQPFLLGDDIREYCSRNIEPAVCEIDHVGVSVLADVLLKPAGFALEILYLDRSPGTEVTPHCMDPLDVNGIPFQNPPTIRLLYRPGHYDLLYKLEEVLAIPSHSLGTSVYLAHDAEDYTPISRYEDVLSVIPGMSLAASASNPMGWNYGALPLDYNSTPISAAPIATDPSYQSVHMPNPVHDFPSHHLAMEQPVNVVSSTIPIDRPGPFRPSAWELKTDFSNLNQAIPFQTSIFRNSHYNTAHFLNPDFQPEEWSPDSEYVTTNNKQRSKSSSQ